MNLPTKLAITGLGLAVLMLLAFLTPAPAMAQIASCTTDASGNTRSAEHVWPSIRKLAKMQASLQAL